MRLVRQSGDVVFTPQTQALHCQRNSAPTLSSASSGANLVHNSAIEGNGLGLKQRQIQLRGALGCLWLRGIAGWSDAGKHEDVICEYNNLSPGCEDVSE